MNRKIKLLHVLWSGEIGGTEEYIYNILKGFDLSRYEIHFCFLSKKGIIYDEVRKFTDNVVYIGMASGFDIKASYKLFQFLRKAEFDVIHSHSTNILANTLISFLSKPKKIFSEHVSPGAKDAFEKRKIFYKLFLHSYNYIIAISEVVKQKLVEDFHVEPEKILVIHNGVAESKYNDSYSLPLDLAYLQSNSNYIVGFVGRMVGFKRPQLFIEAAAEILKKNKNFHFVMVGDGPENEKCKELIHRYKINDHFEILGFRRDIPNILRLFDAFLFTSLCEGFGIVIIEAMAMGVPVFAVNDGAVPEIINHKVNGFLLGSIDPKSIAHQIIEGVQDDELILKIKKQCVEDVRSRFSIDTCVQKMEGLYQKALSNG